jgi:hypothetical protein
MRRWRVFSGGTKFREEGPLRNCGLGKSRNNKAKERDEDGSACPNSSNLAEHDGENALSKRARLILGCQHVFPQNRQTACEEYSILAYDGPRSEERLPTFVSSRCDVSVAAIPTVAARKLWITNIKTFSTIA